ncbi:hypothetical protein J7J18_04300 [bacterium]|nr:hypothetical protein [bacterium]
MNLYKKSGGFKNWRNNLKKMRYIFDTPKTAEIGLKSLSSKDLTRL